MQQRDPRLKKPTYVPEPDMEFSKEGEKHPKESKSSAPIKIITKDTSKEKPINETQQPKQPKTSPNNKNNYC